MGSNPISDTYIKFIIKVNTLYIMDISQIINSLNLLRSNDEEIWKLGCSIIKNEINCLSLEEFISLGNAKKIMKKVEKKPMYEIKFPGFRYMMNYEQYIRYILKNNYNIHIKYDKSSKSYYCNGK